MADAYIVAGPESSGNRLLAAILVRSGCAGEGSTRQPQNISDIPRPDRDYVLISHHLIPMWVRALKEIGYERVHVIIIVREPIANTQSAVNRGHQKTIQEAKTDRLLTIASNIADSLAHGIEPEVITYEGICEEWLKMWLPTIGLQYQDGPLSLPGQHAPPTFNNMNHRHYE